MIEGKSDGVVNYSKLEYDDVYIPLKSNYSRRSKYSNIISHLADLFDEDFDAVEASKYSFEHFKGRCWSCGLDLFSRKSDSEYYSTLNNKIIMENFHNDHLIAISRGGPTTVGNIAHCCEECNIRKSNRNLWSFIEDNLTGGIQSPFYSSMEEARKFFWNYFCPWRDKFSEYFSDVYNLEGGNDTLFLSNNYKNIDYHSINRSIIKYFSHHQEHNLYQPKFNVAISYREKSCDYGEMFTYFEKILDQDDREPMSKDVLTYCSKFFESIHMAKPNVPWTDLTLNEQKNIIENFLQDKIITSDHAKKNFRIFRRACKEIHRMFPVDFSILSIFFEKIDGFNNQYSYNYEEVIKNFNGARTSEIDSLLTNESIETNVDVNSINNQDNELKNSNFTSTNGAELSEKQPLDSFKEEDEEKPTNKSSRDGVKPLEYYNDGVNSAHYRKILQCTSEKDFDRAVGELFNSRIDFTCNRKNIGDKWLGYRKTILGQIKHDETRMKWFDKWNRGPSTIKEFLL